MAYWILQCSPRVWDVFSWWEETDEELGNWSVSHHLQDIQKGDQFALWVGGSEAGVYATGRFTNELYEARVGGGAPTYWKKTPRGGRSWFVGLEVEQYLFDRPIWKRELLSDPSFADSLIVRMPRTANPIPLTAREWKAIATRTGRRTRPRAGGADARVTTRRLGSFKESSTMASVAVERVRTYREHQLVKRYERFVRRPLEVKQVVLPSNERLVIDAFDDAADLLIEAKATATRQDVRMAIGQLLDYRRYFAPGGEMAVLLPERPSDDLLELLHSVPARAIYETSSGRFKTA